MACSDQLLWTTLDLSVLQSNFIRIPRKPYVYVDSPSQEKLARLLNICLNFSRGNIQTLIFHHNLYVKDNQLTFTAERCPRLKRLVMPFLEQNKKVNNMQGYSYMRRSLITNDAQYKKFCICH